MTDFGVAAHHRVEAAFPGHAGEIDAVPIQGTVAAFRIGVIHPVAAPNLGQRLVNALPVDAVRFQDFGGKPLRLHNRGDEQMLSADEIIVETRHFRPGVFQQALRPGRGVNLMGFVG